MRAKAIWCVIALFITVVGCSKSESSWKHAKAANTIEAYQAFLKEAPGSSHTSAAQEKIRVLSWQKASTSKQSSEIRNYISQYPAAENIAEAKALLTRLEGEEEIAGLNLHIKNFLDGVAASNIIKELNGMPFTPRNQNESSGTMLVGAGNVLERIQIKNRETQKTLVVIFKPNANLMVDEVEELHPENGVSIVFTSGRKYTYQDGKWLQ